MPLAETAPLRNQIGPYQIVARVGAGGMGVVFKGWDPRLERDVAIKILHPDAAADADRQRRLLAEGRAASALTHPNILRVYDAAVDGSSYYLVSEWLEGNSLRDELSRGPLPIKRLLDLAVQIADGLAAAHAMGIVHRDIKPENVMLARDGTARIVDFGLARHEHRATSGQETAHLSTVSLDGGISGTPPYMSPEQARGQAGDFRTDQFSFGVLVYEMATGVRAFRRETVTETLAAVLHDEPKPLAEVNRRVPVALTWVVEQCLAKDPSERYAATEDLARELRRVRDRLREALNESQGVAERSPWRWRAATAVTGLVAIAAIGVAAVLRVAPEPDLRFTPIASAAVYEGTPAWSPNGESLAWVADVDGVLQVFVRRLADAVPTQLTRGRFDAEQPFWAPDGKGVYFISRAGEGTALWNVGSAGGRAELILENVNHAAIDRAGKQLALLRMEGDSQTDQRLWWADADGQNPVREMRPPFGDTGYGTGGQLQFRPDGQALLAWVFGEIGGAAAISSYYLIPIRPDEAITATLPGVVSKANLQPVSWLPDNRHVVIGAANALGGNRHLWIADTHSPQVWPLTATHTNETFPSASPDGRRIAYASEEVDFDLVNISEDGRSQRRVLVTARNEMDPAWSPLGDQFAFVTDRVGSMEIWVRSRDGQWERPVVTATDFGSERTDTLGALAFSPDGLTLAYQRRGPDESVLWLTPAAGGAPVRLLPEDHQLRYQDAPSWSPDGEWISFVGSGGAASNFSLGKIRRGSSEVIKLLDPVVPFTRAAWSPDGQWIVCETFDGVKRVPANGGPPETITSESLLAYAWAPDSRRLVALVDGESIGHLAMIEIDTVTRDVKTLNPDLGTIPIAYQPIRGFSYAKGQGFLTSLANARSDIWVLDGFQLPGNRLMRWLRR